MADEENKASEKRHFNWKLPRYGVVPEIYANFAHASWTLYDVRIRVGQLVPSPEDENDFVVEERAAVTFSWPQAKVLRDMLTGLVASYEAANGEIKPLQLPKDPTVTAKPDTDSA